MGKLGKEVIDQIHAMLGEGYNKTEVATKLGIDRKTVGKYAVNTQSSLVREDTGKVKLSLDSDITKVLYDIQAIMGAPSLVGAVKQVYQDVVSTAKFRVTYWPTYGNKDEEFTMEAMTESLLGFINYLETEHRNQFNSLRESEVEIERLKEFAEERYEDGLEQGRGDNAIFVRCAHCGKACQVEPLSETHKFITQVLMENGWGHNICVRRDEYRRTAGSRALDAVLRY